MNNDFSRRNFVALAGAGAGMSLLSGCENGGKNDDAKPLICMNYGADPHKAPSYETAPSPMPSFEPKFLLLMHVDFTNKWEISVNHAHYEFTGNEDDRLNKARAIFKEKCNPGSGNNKPKFRDLSANKPYSTGTYPLDYDDIQKDNFRFGSQHEIFIYVDNKNIDVLDGKLISFSDKNWDGDVTKPNYSFFNAKKADASGIDNGQNNGKLIRMQNWMTKENGKEILRSDEYRYSMNIHFLMRGSSSSPTKSIYVPLVIDPDTGNGFGHRP